MQKLKPWSPMVYRDYDKIKWVKVWQTIWIGWNRYIIKKIDWDNIHTKMINRIVNNKCIDNPWF